MKWTNLFQSHILGRGEAYYENGHVSSFSFVKDGIEAEVEGGDTYDVVIRIEGDTVMDMECTCPYAAEGRYCKHMAAVLFRMEEELSEGEKSALNIVDEKKMFWEEKFAERRNEVIALVNKLPKEKIDEILVSYLLSDHALENQLRMEYSEKIDASQIRALNDEIDDIIKENSIRGFVDWYHALDFISDLCAFLDNRVAQLIDRGYLSAAFELTNRIFGCIGTIDMDDSDGGSTDVAERCYESWKKILEKSSDKQKEQMKKWFEAHQSGYVIDFIEEYLLEFLHSEFQSKEWLMEQIGKLDEIIEDCKDKNACTEIYSVYYGSVDPVLKRIEYMQKLHYSGKEIQSFREENRHFYVIREGEIDEAIEKEDYRRAIKILVESKRMDKNYPYQLEKYSRKLIDLYNATGNKKQYEKELLHYLLVFKQENLDYIYRLKESIQDSAKWENIVNRIIAETTDIDFQCKLLNKEGRFEELLEKIEETENIFLLNEYETVLGKKFPERIIRIYEIYLSEEVDKKSDRHGYRELMQYMKIIMKCKNGKKKAEEIATNWREKYKRRTAMMDELRKIGL